MMKILLISISAPPKNSPESVQTGRYLKYLAQNNDVTLLTTEITGGWEPEDKGLLKYLKNVRRIVSLRSLPPRFVSFLKKIYPALLVPDEGVAAILQGLSTGPDPVVESRRLSVKKPWLLNL